MHSIRRCSIVRQLPLVLLTLVLTTTVARSELFSTLPVKSAIYLLESLPGFLPPDGAPGPVYVKLDAAPAPDEEGPGGCENASDCNDGNPCTTDNCVQGSCINTPKNCDDGNLCTSDSCNPSTGSCEHVDISSPNDSDCDGINNDEDSDDDNDGIPDEDDDDDNGDGIPDAMDLDGDGVLNSDDNDVDGDGQFNGEDDDIDGDGIPNGDDPDPDGDGDPNDNDNDGDGIPNDDDDSPNGCTGNCDPLVDLLGDANHDGTSGGSLDEPLEDTVPGVIVLCNTDDDDDDGQIDAFGSEGLTVEDGDPDYQELSDMTIVSVVCGGIPQGLHPGEEWRIRFILESPGNHEYGGAADIIRVFDRTPPATPPTPILGAGLQGGGLVFEKAVNSQNPPTALQVEGLQFAAKVKLRVELRDSSGTVRGSDRMQFTVAPFIMVPNTAPCSSLLISRADDAFFDAIVNLAYGASCIYYNEQGDVWMQDAWEFGFSSTPWWQFPIVMPQAFETLRAGRPLQGWGRQEILGPVPHDIPYTGLITRLAESDNAFAYGGNLEVTPPLPNHPRGRIVVGSMPDVQKEFLTRQGMQTPLIELDTSWLSVGHIDEFMNFAPDAGGTGWRLVLSSPDLAFSLLGSVHPSEPLFYCDENTEVQFGEATGGTADTLIDNNPGVNFLIGSWQFVRIYEGPGKGQIAEITDRAPNQITIGRSWRFVDAQDTFDSIAGDADEVMNVSGWDLDGIPSGPNGLGQGATKYFLSTCSKMWRDATGSAFPAAIAADEILQDQKLNLWNDIIRSRIATEVSKLTGALQGSEHQVEWIPAIYIGDPNNEDAFAYAPGLVNFQIWTPPSDDYDDPLLWLPKPFGPRLNGVDVFEQEAADELFVPGGVYFVDNWDIYHRREGEVHCGTNVIRFPSELDRAYYDWWDHP